MTEMDGGQVTMVMWSEASLPRGCTYQGHFSLVSTQTWVILHCEFEMTSGPLAAASFLSRNLEGVSRSSLNISRNSCFVWKHPRVLFWLSLAHALPPVTTPPFKSAWQPSALEAEAKTNMIIRLSSKCWQHPWCWMNLQLRSLCQVWFLGTAETMKGERKLYAFEWETNFH